MVVGSNSLIRGSTTTTEEETTTAEAEAQAQVEEAASTSTSTSTSASSSPTARFAEVDALFDSIDTNQDGGISNEELTANLEDIGYPAESIRLLFTVIDKNADGMISKAEMRYAWDHYDTDNLYKAFGVSIVDAAAANADEKDEANPLYYYEQVIDSIRSDANSKDIPDATNNNEITEAVSTSPELLTKLADIIFDLIDTDHNNAIDVEELKLHFRVNGNTAATSGGVVREIGHASSISSESILTALDLNHDGVISRQEMRDGFNQYNPRTLSRALGLQVS